MSEKDNHPAHTDTARPITPIIFDGQSDQDTKFTDFRAVITPVEAEEEPGPKDSSARRRAASSESQKTSEEKDPESPVPTPAAKVSGQAKESGPGSQTSLPPKTPGRR